MGKTALAASLIYAILITSVVVPMLINLATANPAFFIPVIEIKSDGNVAPETSFIKRNGDVYTLLDNILKEYSIRILRSNIVFDGAGHEVEGTMGSYPVIANVGLSLESVTNVTIRDIEVTYFSEGYYNRWLGDVVAENTTNTIFQRVTAGVLRLVNSNFNTITESYASIDIIDSYYNVIFKNRIASLSILGEGNIIAKNNITELSGGSKNSIIANSISSLELGSNNIYYADNVGELTVSGADNLLYSNMFHGDTYVNIEAGRGNQSWDDGEEGNFWTSYKGSDVNRDGIGDKPYTVEAIYHAPDDYWEKITCGIDNYPLMSPPDIEGVSFKLPDWSPVVDPGWVISVLSPQNKTYSESDIPLNFTVSKSAKLLRFSLDGQANVTIIGNTTLTELTYGPHNITLNIDDPLGNTSPSEIIYFSIAEPFPPFLTSFPTVLIAAAIGILAVVVVIASLVYYRNRKAYQKKISKK